MCLLPGCVLVRYLVLQYSGALPEADVSDLPGSPAPVHPHPGWCPAHPAHPAATLHCHAGEHPYQAGGMQIQVFFFFLNYHIFQTISPTFFFPSLADHPTYTRLQVINYIILERFFTVILHVHCFHTDSHKKALWACLPVSATPITLVLLRDLKLRHQLTKTTETDWTQMSL